MSLSPRYWILLCALAFLALFLAYLAPTLFSQNSVEAAATEILTRCDKGGDSSRCYEDEVPALYPAFSIPELFSVIRIIRSHDREYQFCHVLAHKLGELVVAEDPSRWVDVIPLNPSDGMCSNGFVHGVTVGRFRDDVLTPEQMQENLVDFKRACEPRADWAATSLDQAICYHGMGHLFMFITNGDYRRSLEGCGAIGKSPTGDFMRVCREGVFMQTYQPLEPDDFALIELLPEKPTKENYRRLCAQFSEDAEEGACLREAWPFFREEIIEDGGAVTFCSRQPNATETSACYDSVFAILGRQTLGRPDTAEKTCSTVPDSERVKCFASVAGSILEEDRADGQRSVDFCNRAEGETRMACMQTLASRTRFIFGDTPEKASFCSLLPTEVQQQCR